LLEQLKINRYSLYLQDYDGPVGFRIMVAHLDRVQALVIQNANAYEEGPSLYDRAERKAGRQTQCTSLIDP